MIIITLTFSFFLGDEIWCGTVEADDVMINQLMSLDPQNQLIHAVIAQFVVLAQKWKALDSDEIAVSQHNWQ